MKRRLLWMVGAYVLWRWLGPEPRPRFASPQEHPLRVPGRTVFVGDREMFVREAGPADAPVLVLIHGWATDSVFNYHRIIPLLAERFRVIAVDQRNSGRSDLVRSRYDVADVADEIAALISSLGLAPVPFVGYSMGGMVVQEIAHRHPYLTNQIVLAASAARVTRSRSELNRLRVLFSMGRAWDRISKAEFSWVRHRYLRRVKAIDPRHERWLWDSYMARDVNLYYEGGFAVARFDSRSWLPRLQVEALVIIPARDQLIDPQLQHELAGLLGQAEVMELEDGAHEAILTHASEIVAAITDFLHEPAAPGATGLVAGR